MRIGGHRLIPVNTRVIAATNRQIEKAVESGEFRADLFYRLSVLHLRVPALRDHLEDLPLLVEHIARSFDALVARRLQEKLSVLLPAWQSYYWPGNVRELENMVRRFAVMISDPEFQGEEDGKTISCLAATPKTFPRRGRPRKDASGGATDPDLLRQKVAEFETGLLNRTLDQCRGNRAETARLLGIGRTTVWRKLRRS
jgi:DNA-binding NtrC family response regulator